MAVMAGRLNTRVTLQTNTPTTDAGGGKVDVWADTATLWAAVEELSGTEGFTAQQIASSLSHRVTIRHRSVTPQQRLLYGARVLKINAVLNPGQLNERLELLCTEEDI